MSSNFTIEINRKAKAFIYREDGKVFRFEMDTRARPMVAYFHEFSDDSTSNRRQPLTDEMREKIGPNIIQYLMKNRIHIKATFTGLRTPRDNG